MDKQEEEFELEKSVSFDNVLASRTLLNKVINNKTQIQSIKNLNIFVAMMHLIFLSAAIA